jgi:hypothetical protein
MVDPRDVYTVKTFVVKWFDGQWSWLVLGRGILQEGNCEWQICAQASSDNLKPLKPTA